MREPITSFSGKYRFLSNFHLVQIPGKHFNYPSVEHAYQAAKCADPKDRVIFSSASAETGGALTAGAAKAMGRKVKVRPDWEEVKRGVMLSA